jgi:ABC-type uncharacterized transport system substrate-binding protein
VLDETPKVPDLSARGDDAFIAVGTRAAALLHAKLDAATPLVYCMVSDPETLGLAEGRQTFGVSTNVPLAAQFQLIAEALPAAKAVGLLYRSEGEKSARLLKSVKESLPKGMRLEAVAVDKHESVAKAIEALLAQEVDVVWTSPDATVYDVATVRSLLLTSIRKNTPVFGFSPAFVRAGALLGVGIDPRSQGKQAAGIVHQVLQRKTPATQSAKPLTREQCFPQAEFQIAVNLIVARKLSIALPKALVQRATQVFDEKKSAEE